MTYKQFVRILAKSFNCEEVLPRKSGSHRLWHNPDTQLYSNIPDHRSKDLKRGTIRATVKQLGISWKDFNKFR